MSELYFQAPTKEERNATYKGMGFEEFKQLSDEEIEILRQEEHQEFRAALEGHGLFTEEWRYATAKLEMFLAFKAWRRSGVPDRDMTYEEWDARVGHYIDIRRAADPSYGTLTEQDISHLTDQELEVTYLALDENDPPTGAQPIVEVGGTIEDALTRLNVSYEDLVAKGVLEPYATQETVVFDSHTGYALAGKFGEFVLAMPYLPEESNS